MAEQGQGVALDPPGAKPLDLKYMKINGFPKAAGLWWVQGKALALPFSIGQSFEWLVLFCKKTKNSNRLIIWGCQEFLGCASNPKSMRWFDWWQLARPLKVMGSKGL